MKIQYKGKYYTLTPSTSEEVGDHIHLEEYFNANTGYVMSLFIGLIIGVAITLSFTLP